MSADEGMVFVFPDCERVQFTLAQTRVPLDVIFCRNVMIYFDVESREWLVNRLTEYLAPGGYLFVGHSESLIGVRHKLRAAWPSVYMRPE